MAIGPLADALTAVSEPSVERLAGAWLASLTSENTRLAYRRDLVDFLEFVQEHDLDLLSVERPGVDLYARSLEARGLAASTIARRVSALSSFFEYAVDQGVIVSSPTERVKRPKVASDSPCLGLDQQEAVSLIQAAQQSSASDFALVSLLLLNGLRVSEAVGLSIEDLDKERGHTVIRIEGKGGKRRTAPLPPLAQEALRSAAGTRHHGPLILNRGGERMNRHQATRAVRRLARLASISKTISPHSLRHTFVTLALGAGAPIHVVQDAAGHASPETTRRYDRARFALDGHAAYALASHLADGGGGVTG